MNNKRNYLLIFSLFLIMLLILSGCSQDQDERKVDVSGENDYTTLEVSAVTPMTNNESYYGVFYEFTNNTEETIDISNMEASFTNKDGLAISNEETLFAPSILAPGETGYGGVIVYNSSSEYDLESINATITPTFTYSDKESAVTLTVSDPVITEIPYGSEMTDGRGVMVSVENTGEETQDPLVVAGLLNEDGDLIGFASNLTAGSLEAGSQEEIECVNILVYPNNNLDLVKTIVPRVKNTDLLS